MKCVLKEQGLKSLRAVSVLVKVLGGKVERCTVLFENVEDKETYRWEKAGKKTNSFCKPQAGSCQLFVRERSVDRKKVERC